MSLIVWLSRKAFFLAFLLLLLDPCGAADDRRQRKLSKGYDDSSATYPPTEASDSSPPFSVQERWRLVHPTCAGLCTSADPSTLEVSMQACSLTTTDSIQDDDWGVVRSQNGQDSFALEHLASGKCLPSPTNTCPTAGSQTLGPLVDCSDTAAAQLLDDLTPPRLTHGQCFFSTMTSEPVVLVSHGCQVDADLAWSAHVDSAGSTNGQQIADWSLIQIANLELQQDQATTPTTYAPTPAPTKSTKATAPSIDPNGTVGGMPKKTAKEKTTNDNTRRRRHQRTRG